MGLFNLAIADSWAWLILGCILIIAEMLAPGFFLMWVGGAALLTGIVTWVLPIGSSAQFILFAVSAVVSIYAGRRWFARNDIISDDPNLNNRGARLIGEIVTVVGAIEGGSGRVKVSDGVWIAKGADAAVGAHVRITSVDGAVLKVEAV